MKQTMKANTLKALSLVFIMALAIITNGQNNISINTTGNSNEQGAILDLSDHNTPHTYGFLPPYAHLVNNTSIAVITGGVPANLGGLLVYNTNASAVATGLHNVGLYWWYVDPVTPANDAWIYASYGVSGNGTTNYLTRWINTTTLGTGVAQDNGSGVGISGAVITPKNMLDVNGAVAIGTYAGVNTAAAGVSAIISGGVGIATTTPKNDLDVSDPSAPSGQVAIGSYAGTVTLGATVNLAVSGSTGIGTSTPKNMLDVNGGAAIGVFALAAAVPAGTSLAVAGQAGMGNNAPSARAILDLTNATNHLGFLLPQMTNTQMNALPVVNNVDNGMVVFNTTLDCPEIWLGTSGGWTSVTGNAHGNVTFFATGGIQTFIVPLCVDTINVQIDGASASDQTWDGLNGGFGANFNVELTVAPSQTLDVVVGGEGQNFSWGTGGGGGSFIWVAAATTPLVVAGGGGGAGNTTPGNNTGQNASLTTTPTASTSGGAGGSNGAGPGKGGAGGTSGTGKCPGGGGGGWNNSGLPASASARNGAGGQGMLLGGNGGAGATGGGAPGGFGCGGGGGADAGPSADMGGGGGGGGYKGAGGGNGTNSTASDQPEYEGGGGSSYTAGATAVHGSAIGSTYSDGSIIITW